MTEALDYAAGGETGLNFYSVRGELTKALPYRILRVEAIALAQKLVAMGLKRHDTVALIAETQPDFVRIFFACQYAGLIPVPLPLPFAFGGREVYVEHIRRLVVEAKATALFAPKTLIGWLAPFAEEQGLTLCGTVADLADAPEADAGPAGDRPRRYRLSAVFLRQHALSDRRRDQAARPDGQCLRDAEPWARDPAG